MIIKENVNRFKELTPRPPLPPAADELKKRGEERCATNLVLQFPSLIKQFYQLKEYLIIKSN